MRIKNFLLNVTAITLEMNQWFERVMCNCRFGNEKY